MNPRLFPFAARSIAIAGAALAGVALTTLPKPAFAESPDKDPLIARVNGVELRQSDLALAREDLGRSIPDDYDEAKTREYVIKYMTDLIVMSDAAKKDKVGDEADLRRRMELTRKKALMESLLAVTGRDAVTEAAVRAAFDEAISKVATGPQLRIRSIMFKFADAADGTAVAEAAAKAKVALDRIAKGDNFATVATEMSENPNAKLGGDMGFLARYEMTKEYADAAFNLKDGEVSPMIKTSFGWHIIKVEGRRDMPKVEFENVRSRFEQFVAKNAQLKLIEKLRASAKVERFDKQGSADGGTKTN
ncbi:MAG: peptidylprolyl isomerase [Bradyrhizobium sp.]|nr:peptidylprolyl isomerase [Bradyrhizobium sp.]